MTRGFGFMATMTETAKVRIGSGEIACLLRKDLRVFILRDRVLLFGIFFLASLQAFFTEEAFFWLGVLLAGSLAAYVPVIEWIQETDPMLHSLPVRRTAVVTARYLSALFAGVVACISWISAGLLLRTFLDPTRGDPVLWMSPEGLLTYSLAVSVSLALFLPLYFRFGLGRGISVFLVLGGFLLASLVALAGAGTGGEGGTLSGPAARPAFVTPAVLFRERASELMASLGPVSVLALVLAGAGVLLFLSALLSTRWLQGRDIG
jgi:ABC-type transport system involved in multi-copper enzyme maturation permease subunit